MMAFILHYFLTELIIHAAAFGALYIWHRWLKNRIKTCANTSG